VPQIACQLTTQFSKELIASIPNPSFTSAGNLGNPAGGNPPEAIQQAVILQAVTGRWKRSTRDATFALAPGGSAQITLRITGPKGSASPPTQDVINQVLASLVPVTVSQAVNTVDAQAGSTQPPVSAPGSQLLSPIPAGRGESVA